MYIVHDTAGENSSELSKRNVEKFTFAFIHLVLTLHFVNKSNLPDKRKFVNKIKVSDDKLHASYRCRIGRKIFKTWRKEN